MSRPEWPASRALAGGALIVLCAMAALLKARSYDLWWHLATGEQIVRLRAIPRMDDFSFTSAGTPWVDHSWLFQVLLYFAYLAGPAGLTLLKGFCVLGVAAAGFLWLTRRGGSVALAMSVTAVAVVGLRSRLGERPETATLLMAALIAVLLLDLAERPDRLPARFGGIALLTIIWANLHGGALLAPVLAASVAAGTSFLRSRRAVAVTWAAVPLTAVCLLVNPYGFRIFLVPSAITAALSPANLGNPEWARPALFAFPLFYATIAAVLLLLAADLRRGRPLAPARTGLFLVAAVMGAASLRHTGIFFALLPMMIGPRDGTNAPGLIRKALSGAVLLTALVFMALFPPAGARTGFGIDEGRFPAKATDFIDAQLGDARLYNDVAAGGYLIWRGYPGRRVFIDGRNEIHAALLKELSVSLDDGRRWQSLLERHGVEGAIVGYREELIDVTDALTGRRSRSTFSELHFPRATWALVYWDDAAMVFVRREGRFAAVASAFEFRLARPEAWAAGRWDTPDPGTPAALKEEINRKIEDDPECHLARNASVKYGISRPFPSP